MPLSAAMTNQPRALSNGTSRPDRVMEDSPAVRSTADGPASDRRLDGATSVLWRATDKVQLELGARRVVLGNVDHDDVRHLLPVTRNATGNRSAVKRRQREIAALVSHLDELGFVCPDPAAEPAHPVEPSRTPNRHLPASLVGEAAVLRSRTGSAAAMGRRLDATVAVLGPSRLLAPIAVALAAAGVGAIRLGVSGEVTARDACAGGLAPEDEGQRFLAATMAAVHRAAPGAEVQAVTPGVPVDLLILTRNGPLEESLSVELDGACTPHLRVTVEGADAVIGPLVIPGITSCLHCGDLHRTDRDPAWPALAVQLSVRSRHRVPTDGALCTAVAGLAAIQALSFLDGEHSATRDGTLEIHLPDWRLRRRSWPPHPACRCAAATVTGRARQNGPVSSR